MTLVQFAASPWWWVLCSIAWLLIVLELRVSPPTKRRLVALLVAGVGASGAVHAAQLPAIEWCDRLSGWWWYAAGCFLA